jgi:ATP-binding cassette subfamily B protein
MKRYWLAFIFMAIFYHATTLDNIIWPKVTMMLIEALEGYSGDRDNIWPAISGAVMLGALTWLTIEFFYRGAFLLAMRVLPKFEADIRMALFKHVSQQSYNYFSSNMAGSLANKINDMPRSSVQIIVLFFYLFLPALTTTIIMTIMFAQIYPIFGYIISLWVFLHISLSILTAKKCSDYADSHAESRSIVSGRVVDSFANSISVRLFARQKFEYNYVMEQQLDEIKKHKASLWFIEKVRFSLGMLAFFFLGIVLTFVQIYCYKNEIISLGELVFTLQAAFHISTLAWWVGGELPRFFQEIGVCQQALSLITKPIEVLDAKDAQPIHISKGQIEFKHVTFRYKGKEDIFKNNSVIIPSGQKVGLVGFSGSGKTTFVNLLLRYFDVNKGVISIDGQDIAKVTQDSLREQISLIPQEPMLFHRTLMENIRYGNLHASDKEVIDASKKAHCHEFIIKLKHGYNTMVGERGLKISGGQRQRIAIARAILRNTPILVMDEATSALDSLTERKIQESIKAISQNRTTIVIAHRLSTLADMDRILVFNNGDIVEDGSHELLIAQDGYYKKLWNMQVHGFIPDKAED